MFFIAHNHSLESASDATQKSETNSHYYYNKLEEWINRNSQLNLELSTGGVTFNACSQNVNS